MKQILEVSPELVDLDKMFVNSFFDVVHKEARAIERLAEGDTEVIKKACSLIFECRGRVICTGMGKSGHIARKIAATLASTGTPSFFVHPGEASHGDLGMVLPGDVLLALSNSGETRELADILTYAGRRSIPMIAITKKADSTLGRQAAVVLNLPDEPEACAIQVAPTTSTTCALAIGDALAVAVMHARGFGRADFNFFHPGGKLGSQLLTVEQLMHSGDALPVVSREATMEDAVLEMTSKGFGIAAVVTGQKLEAVVTDGDLRRNIKGLMDKKVAEVVSYSPKFIGPKALASEALGLMSNLKVTALCVVDEDGSLVGLLHLHDCLRAEVA